jgi:hypothetical protein
MARVDDILHQALIGLPPKPAENAAQAAKKRYSEQMSAVIAYAFAEELRHRGLLGALPAVPGELGTSGAERRMSGGIGAKKVDVTWATEDSGLILGLSIKTINWRDTRTGNYQKNLINRRGDLLIEATTLHRRFPYAVLIGWLFLDAGAASDDTPRRRSTFENAQQRLRLFTGRDEPHGRDEQFERLLLCLVEATPFHSSVKVFESGDPTDQLTLTEVFDSIIETVAERNFDFYEAVDGSLKRTT